MRKRTLHTLYCLLFGIFSIIALYAVSDKLNHSDNAFVRLFPPHAAMPEKIMDIKTNAWYFSGVAGNKIYLGNYLQLDRLFVTDVGLKDSSIKSIDILLNGHKLATSAKVVVDSPYLHIMDGNTPVMFRGNLNELTVQYDSATGHFTAGLAISGSSYLLRSVDEKLGRNVLLKQAGQSVIQKNDILEKQVDGVFCTDGSMNYDAATGRLVYVYNYRNQFICMDSNLTVLYKGKTVDTVSRAKFSVDTILSKHAVTLSSPPSSVNKQTAVAGGRLFIHSNLMGSNENKETFMQCSVIDVYNLADGKYQHSFYLPDYYHKKIRDFRVIGNRLFALYDHYSMHTS